MVRRAVSFLVAAVFGTGIASVASACPNVGLSGVQTGYTNGEDLWTPNSYAVVAGGDSALQNCGFNHSGFVISQPDFEFQIDGLGGYNELNLRTSGSCDTILLVNDSTGGWWYDDDGGSGTNASITIGQPVNGVWDVWVGTFGANTCQTTLTLETF